MTKKNKSSPSQTNNTREKLEKGLEVYYKRNCDIKWKGPREVVGQDGAIIFTRHKDFL